MMLKRIGFFLVVLVLALNLGICGFAKDSGVGIRNKATKDTSQFLVSITRPEGDESTFKKSYVICGNSSEEEIRVRLMIYDDEAGTYKDFENTDGTSYWDIGVSGIFMKEVILPTTGANNIRILAYEKKNEQKIDKLTPDKDLQINSFTVTLLNKNIKDTIKGGFFKITDFFNKYLF